MTAPIRPADPDLFFFLSFAGESDPDDELVDRFFRDLCVEVRVAAGIRRSQPASIGFLSIASLRLGSDWPLELACALGDCRVLVALCGPAYFHSPWCGMEWQAFSDRLAAYRRAADEHAPSLLPVCWAPLAMPHIAAEIQYIDRRLSVPVSEVGLRQLMRMERYRDDYVEFVSNLAGHIVRTSRRYPLPPAVVSRDLAALPRAFPTAAKPPVPAPRRARPKPDGTALPELDQRGNFPHIHGV